MNNVTSNTLLKKDVRLFADINGVNYTSALREFDLQAGKPVSEARFRKPGPDYAAEAAWAAARGLKPNGHDRCFHELGNASGRVGYRDRDHWDGPCSQVNRGETALKDHSRSYRYRAPGASRGRTAVFTFAPYRHWNDQKLIDEVTAFATEYDVRYRIGYDRDATYGGGAVPVVFWNPRVIDLA